MVEFAGWRMPLEYVGILDEHRAVREGVGLFDVSHMGRIEISGPPAEAFLRYLLANDVAPIAPGRMLYSLMCQADGGIIDDLMALRLEDGGYVLVVNAATKTGDLEWIEEQSAAFPECEVRDRSPESALLALQGPEAEQLLQPFVDRPLDPMRYLDHAPMEFGRRPVRVSRSGYTGEDGFEILTDPGDVSRIWDRLCEAGAQPAGLGARDTLRLESGYRLYGSDMDRSTSPFEAGLGWTVKLTPGRRFIGAHALRERKEKGTDRNLVGLVLRAKGVPRRHQPIFRGGEPVGEVTSGSFSPVRREGIALGYVPSDCREPGTRLEIESRNRRLPAEVVPLPFVPLRTRSAAH